MYQQRQYKCLFCNNYAMPTAFITCENLKCFNLLKSYRFQKGKYKNVETARELARQLSTEIRFIESKRMKLRALKKFMATENRLKSRRFR